MPETEAISAHRLRKVYRGGRGIFELDFAVREAEIFGFLGPNGACGQRYRSTVAWRPVAELQN